MSKSNIGEVLFGIAGLVGISCAIGAYVKVDKINKKLDKSIDELASDMEVDISEELIDEAVKRAVRVEVVKAVTKATNLAIGTVKTEIHTRVASAVNDEYDKLTETVLKEITTEAAKIDVSRVRRDVEKAAKEAALKKFDDNLDDILEKFNSSLDNTSRIYSSIRETLAKGSDSSKEFVLRI